jgi:predicted transcriptional regulator
VSDPVVVTQHAVVESEGNGTTDYILKLLVEKPRISREVQLAVGRTREHTARLMKKLHDSGLVSRDVNTKPFRYNITDVGRERLEEKVAPPAG